MPSWLRATLGAGGVTVNSVVHILPLLFVALLKLVLRWRSARAVFDRWLMAIAASWIDVNTFFFDRLTDTRVVVTGMPEAMLDGQLLVICNHRSWVDIPVLQKLFNRHLPLLRFFLKSQLIWVPMLGLAWWALDFPFMKRYSREQIQRRPELAGRDIAATRKACKRFRDIPVAIVNFVEGTRFNESKRLEQESDYHHLLKPRAGGTAFVLDAMGDSLDTLVDVTLVYPHGRGEFADLLANRIPEVRVHIRTLPIPESLRGRDYREDLEFQAEIRDWINRLWQDKDERIARMLEESD
jgi:1-acyl-sn-glycerol-3-phosphate acyltransferase